MLRYFPLFLATFLLVTGAPPASAALGDPPDLIAAAKVGDAHKTYAALERGDDPEILDDDGHTPLELAVQHGFRDVAKILIAGHAKPDRIDASGKPPLFWAADQADGPMVDLLLKSGAKVDQTAKGGMTPLMAAARKGAPDIVSALLSVGADATRSDYSGRDALSWAEDGRNPQVMALLRKAQGR